MRIRLVFLGAALLSLLTSCKPFGQQDAHVRSEEQARRIVGFLGDRSYERIYAKFSRKLKETHSKKGVVSSLRGLREAVGGKWHPKLLTSHSPARPDGPVGLTYGLTLEPPGEYTFSFWLKEKGLGHEIVGLEVGMPFSEGPPEAREAKDACDRFLSLLAGEKDAEAQKMVSKRMSGFPGPSGRVLGKRYADMKDGNDIRYRYDLGFAKGRRVETVTLLRKEDDTEEVQISFRRGENGRLRVAGVSITNRVEE